MNVSSTAQPCVTLSTNEAEYVTLVQRANTVLFTKVSLDFVKPQVVDKVVTMYFEDNQETIAMYGKNPFSEGQMKHIDVRYHFIR